MNMRMLVSAVVMGFGLTAVAMACPKDKKTADGAKAPCGSVAVKTVSDKAPCSKSAVTVAAKANDGRSETASPCGKDCTKDCCKNCGKDCTKDCCKKSAKTVSAKSTPCSKGAKTASTGSPCTKGAKTASADGGCPIAAKVKTVLASLPAMKYRIGDETTGCSKSAAAMAEKAGTSMKYVVADGVFETEGEAIVKLVALLEKEAEGMQTIQFVADGKCGRCPMTAKSVAKSSGTAVTYRIGGVDFKNKEDAQKVVKLVSDAVSNGKFTSSKESKGGCCASKNAAKLKSAEAKVRKIVEVAAAASFSL